MRFDALNSQGKFWLQRVADKDTENHNAGDEGRLIYSRDDEKVYLGTDTEWLLLTGLHDVMAVGTQMLFGYWPLPDNWNLLTDNNDTAVMITSAGASVGTNAGTWTISGLDSQGAHDHGGATGGPNKGLLLGGSEPYDQCAGPSHTHSIQVDGLHTHTFDGTWRPAYVKLAEGEYQ
jgi:hypothetical protein